MEKGRAYVGEGRVLQLTVSVSQCNMRHAVREVEGRAQEGRGVKTAAGWQEEG